MSRMLTTRRARTPLSTTIMGFLCGFLLSTLGLPVLTAQFRANQRTELLKTDLTGCPGKEVVVELNELEPGTSGKHYHQGHSLTYVLEGSEIYRREGKPETVTKRGDVLHEAPMEVPSKENAVAVKLLTVRILEKGKPLTVRVTP